MPSPTSSDETLRLDALRRFDILDTQAEANLDRLTALAARLFRMPIALVSLVGQDRERFKSCYGLNKQDISRNVSLCAQAILQDEVFVVTDAALDTRFAANPLITGEPGIRFYAGASLQTLDGYTLGSLCVMDTVPREFSAEDRQALTDMAALVVEAMESRLSQKKVLESEHRLSALLDATSDIITVLDDQGIIRYQSPPITAILGYDPEEMIGRNVLEFVHPKDTAKIEVLMKSVGESSRTGENNMSSLPVQFRFLHQDGSWHFLEAIGQNCLDVPGLEGSVISSRDVTERRHADERLRLLESVAVHANDAILITEAEPVNLPGPRIRYANKAFLEITGYTLEEIVGQTPRILQGEGTSSESRAQIRQALEAWQPIRIEMLNYKKDGTPFWVELSITPVSNERGWFTHWVSVQRDITEHKEAQVELNIAKEEAERANLAKSEFLSRMSHELRTPLNAILGFGQLLGTAQLADDDQESVDQILKGGKHLLNLINEVLDIAQVESGHLNLSLESVDAGVVGIETLALVRTLAKQRGITLRNYSPLRPLYVIADQQRLKQILLNLLSNAVKYNRVGGNVTLECKIVRDSHLRLSVRDEGEGIPLDKQHRLFVPFDRLGADRDGIEGTGVGLALSRHLAEAMGGTLDFQSEAGQGSTFWVDLPLADAETAQELEPVKGSSSDLALEKDAALPELQVLCIEDNLANLRLIERLLKRRPVRMLSAQQGNMGLELARQHLPALILLDIHLPDVTGMEVLLKLREDSLTQHIPVVVLSADASPSQIQKLLDVGAQFYLTKPIEVSEFYHTIDQVLVRQSPLTT
jgi:PAS domain S-box-containing protein